MKRTILSVLVLLLLPLPAWAATLTVCSSGCSYTDIQSAYNVAGAGDVVEIRDSRAYTFPTSQDYISMSKSGTAGNPITIQVGAGYSPTFARTGGSTTGVFVITGSWNVLKGVNITGTADGGGIMVNGDNNVIDGCRLNRIDQANLVNGMGGDGISINDGWYNTVKNCWVGDVSHAGITLYNILGRGAKYNKVLNNVIVNNYGTGIIVCKPNTAYNLVEGNIISRTGYLTTYGGKTGIQITGTSNNTIRKNVIYDTYYKGMQLSVGNASDGTVAVGNYIYNNTFFSIGTKSVDAGNMGILFTVAGTGTTLRDNKFYNNIVYKSSSGTCTELTGIVGQHPPVFAYYTVIETDAGDSLSQLTSNDWNGNVLKNNCLLPYFDGAPQPGFANSVWYRNSNGSYWQTWTVSAVNGVGSMSGNIAVNPMFASEDTSQSNWWFLRSGSPLIDAGIVVNDPNASTGGWSQMTYSGARPDIGAYEAGGTGGSATAPAAPRNLRIIN